MRPGRLLCDLYLCEAHLDRFCIAPIPPLPERR